MPTTKFNHEEHVRIVKACMALLIDNIALLKLIKDREDLMVHVGKIIEEMLTFSEKLAIIQGE